MANGRFVSKSTATDKAFNSLSVVASLVYMMTIPHLDRDGKIWGDPDVLWGTVCPKRREFLDTMDAIINEWIQADLVRTYSDNGDPVLWFKGFSKNQQGMRYDREAPSQFGPTPDEVRTNSGSCRAEVEVEVEVEEEQILTHTFESSTAKKQTDLMEPTEQQALFGAVCDAVGWDYKTIDNKSRGRVAQTAGILKKAGYCVDDVNRFVDTIWVNDWRYTKNNSAPTLEQLRQEIGKIKNKYGDLSSNGVNKDINFSAIPTEIGY
jgi:hypothetical protein